MNRVIPGILETDFSEIEKKLSIIKPFSRWVHIDFLDGKFSKDLSFMDFSKFEKFKEDFFMEAHLMVENPTQYLKPLSKLGFRRFFGHLEKMDNLEEFIAEGQILGEVGIALDLDTPVSQIKVTYDDLDAVLIMSVKAGKSGQMFSESSLSKIKSIREQSQIPIEVDGGINDKTLVLAREAGAQRFIATSFIFQNKDPMEAFEKLSSIA